MQAVFVWFMRRFVENALKISVLYGKKKNIFIKIAHDFLTKINLTITQIRCKIYYILYAPSVCVLLGGF